MPRGQAFIIKKLTSENMIGYVSSNNLRLGISDYEYSELGESLMDSVSIIGSYTSLLSGLDVIVLEDEYAEYLMESGDF
jgi:hypothetical protein